MTNIQDYLSELGLSDTEIKLYLALLETGPVTVRDLAEATEIKRTTAYLYVDQLIEKGLVLKLVKGTLKQIAANKPEESIQYLVQQKIHDAKKIEQKFPGIFNQINSIFPESKEVNEAEIKYYKGKAGVKKIYEDALQAQEIRSYVDISDIENIFPENPKLFDEAFKRNSTLRMYEMVENSPQAKERMIEAGKREHYSFKILPEDVKLTAQDILIYDGKVGIINLKDNIHGVILHNSDFYNNFKLIFDFFWKIIP